jgi:exonuclease SbcC
MQILSVSLKNFKTHRDKHFTFSPGTNAICGENGAGKTSILEAIAWVLFNYQGDYSKEDLIRNGSGSAEVTVEFISNLDSRTYTVQRSTTKGYTLFDPQLNARLPYTRIKDEVLPWLREHLGVTPGTDLGELFACTVGVPQGTFTADFLRSAENRKTVFDKILKVEEYKTVYKDLNNLRRYAEDRVAAIEAEIATYEERLSAWEDLNARSEAIATDIAQNRTQIQALDDQLVTLEQQRDDLKAKADKLQVLQRDRQQLQAQIEGQQQAIALLTQSLVQAQQAVKICTDTRSAFESYQAADLRSAELNQQQTQRQTLLKKQQQLQQTLETRATDLTRLQLQLDGMQAATEEISKLQPLVQEQGQLEAQIQLLQQQQQAIAQIQGALQATQEQATQQAQQIEVARQEIQRLETLRETLTEIPDLEQQRDRLQQQLSRIETGRQFEAELRQLVTVGQTTYERYQAQASTAMKTLEALEESIPLLSTDAITTLKVALESGVEATQSILAKVEQILADLSQQTNADTLRSRLKATQHQLADRIQQQAIVSALPDRQRHLAQLREQHLTLDSRIQSLQEQLVAGATLNAQVAEAQKALQALENPKERTAILTQSLQPQATVQRRYDEMVVAQTGIQRQIEDLATQLQDFADLDAAIAVQTQLKQTHQPDYLLYLQNERIAQDAPRLTADLDTAQQDLLELQQTCDRCQQALDAAGANFNPEQAQHIDRVYQDVRSQRDRLAGSLPQQEQLFQEYQRQIDDLKELALKRDSAEAERQQRERLKRFITFARKAYKEAGPRITERYVQQISQEGDRLFRELLNRPNVALTWTRDYEILVQEGPNQRRFVNLSGGEQMCAALAVRLALLKVLADIDIAFFDEPTTNMDRARRESLAEAIARIRSFNQLFVISHDDTFEKVTENIIVVERDSD